MSDDDAPPRRRRFGGVLVPVFAGAIVCVGIAGISQGSGGWLTEPIPLPLFKVGGCIVVAVLFVAGITMMLLEDHALPRFPRRRRRRPPLRRDPESSTELAIPDSPTAPPPTEPLPVFDMGDLAAWKFPATEESDHR